MSSCELRNLHWHP